MCDTDNVPSNISVANESSQEEDLESDGFNR